MIFRAFRDRSRILSQSSLIQTVLCFKNHGFFAGKYFTCMPVLFPVPLVFTWFPVDFISGHVPSTYDYCVALSNLRVMNTGASLAHPHAQMIALPIVPSRQEKRQELAREYYRLHGKCLFCDYMKFELREKVSSSVYTSSLTENTSQVRIIEETSDFIAVIPFAATIPYQTTIFPRRHNHQVNFWFSNMISIILKSILHTNYDVDNVQFTLSMYSYTVHTVCLFSSITQLMRI